MLPDSTKGPSVVQKVHVVNSLDSARIEIVLTIGRLLETWSDDRDAVGSIRMLDFPSLNQKTPARKPFE
jgi:hypothetical protein